MKLINIDVILAVLISFAVTVIACRTQIPFLTRQKLGQTVRKEGVQAHLKKSGTPTFGLAILLGALVGCVFFIPRYPHILPILFLTLGFGIIGFIDDYQKISKKSSDGLSAKQKMFLQIVVTAIFLLFLWLRDPACLDWRIPFTNGYVLSGPVFRIISTLAGFFVIIGTDNGVNFTDGLDGLASSVTAAAAVYFFICSAALGEGIEPICAAMFGALLGFLLFNSHPAKVFMGDTGSLALGGFVAGCAYAMQMPIFIVFIGFIYLVEVISVIIQVTYFKKTGGKRFFKMAPIHHHFELCGWSEPRIVMIFTAITILLGLVSLIRF